jgi:hypothetical protein
MIVQHREQIGLPELAFVDDLRPVHAVGLPHVVDELRFEFPAVFRKPGVLF